MLNKINVSDLVPGMALSAGGEFIELILSVTYSKDQFVDIVSLTCFGHLNITEIVSYNVHNSGIWTRTFITL